MKSNSAFTIASGRLILLAIAVGVAFAGSASAANLYPSLPGVFGTGGDYAPGDISGQKGWYTASNSWVSGSVVPLPAGSPSTGQGLLISTNSHQDFAGVTTGVVTPLSGPYGTPGSSTVYAPTPPQNSVGSTPVGNSASFDFWFRSGPDTAAAATAEGINNGTFFFQSNLASGSDRFGRPGLFQSDGATYEVQSDSYKSYNSNNQTDNSPTEVVATGLNWGQWYHMVGNVTFGPLGSNAGVFTNGDTLTETIYDANGNVKGSLADGSTWTLAWAFPSYFGFPPTGGQQLFAIDGLNFLTRDGSINTNAPLMFLNLTPEPSSYVLMTLGAFGMLLIARRRRRA